MAPALTSNSFLLTTTPYSKLISFKNPKRLTVCAKKSGGFPSFRIGKKPDDESSGEEAGETENPNPFGFNFDFGKVNVSDMKSLIPVVGKPSTGDLFNGRKDGNTVFVAGATGVAGIRIAQTLLRQGFNVRAGVPELGAAQDLARLAVNYKIISPEESKRLNAVESTYKDAESIAKAIGNATKAVVTIGPAENGPTTEVNTAEALQFIQAAQLAGVGHVTIIYDESPFVTTNNVLDGISIFFNNLFAKSQPLTLNEFLDSLVQTDVKYTLIKTKLTDDYAPESSYNVVVTAEGIVPTNDFKVAKSQIASLVADVFSNTEVAENKVVEVGTDPDAPARPVSELFSAIPEDGRRKAYLEAMAMAKAEEDATKATEKAAEATKKVEKQEPMAANLAEEAQELATTANTTFTNLMSKFKSINNKPLIEEPKTDNDSPEPDSRLSWQKLSSQFASAVKNPSELPKVRIATIRGQAKAQSLPRKKAIVKKPVAPRTQPKQKESNPEVKKIFGGIFQQETIYVDD